MAETLRLLLVTPERTLLDEEVDEVRAPGTVGEFGVLPNHITFLSSLQAGRLEYTRGSQSTRLALSGGFAEVVDNVMTVLADSAELADEIDLEAARTALGEAEEQLKTLGETDPDYAETAQTRQWAQARVDVAGGR